MKMYVWTLKSAVNSGRIVDNYTVVAATLDSAVNKAAASPRFGAGETVVFVERGGEVDGV